MMTNPGNTGQQSYPTIYGQFHFFLMKDTHMANYSRGQAKSTNKNGNPLMAEKVTGKRADMLREASGQISAKSHEPLWRKCPYKEIIPEILASTPKSARKNMKNSAIASFHGEQSAHQFSKQVIGPFSRKKMLNIDLNQRFDVTSR